MEPNDTPKTTNDLIAALADGELDLRNQPDAFAQLSQNPQTAKQVAQHQQLKQACAQAMDGPAMKCPAGLAAKLTAIADEAIPAASPAAESTPAASSSSYAGPSVIARIGQWAPAAVAAVLLIAATTLFFQSTGSSGDPAATPSLLSVSEIENFDGQHGDCAAAPEILRQHASFGPANDLEQLPGRLRDYFKTSTDGLRLDLSTIGYEYQLTGACSLPGSGAVHIVYHHKDDADRSISLWISPDTAKLDQKIEDDRVYVEAGKSLDNPVIIWRSNGLLYYLVGDSLDDAHQAVDALRNPA